MRIDGYDSSGGSGDGDSGCSKKGASFVDGPARRNLLQQLDFPLGQGGGDVHGMRSSNRCALAFPSSFSHASE